MKINSSDIMRKLQFSICPDWVGAYLKWINLHISGKIYP